VTEHARSEAIYDVAYDMDLKVPMRDGVLLSADVYRPAGLKNAPAILFRTPYDNGRIQTVEQAVWYARRGYAYASVDCRGRYDSDGSNHHQYPNIDVPVFNMCGWFDAYAAAAFINFDGMQKQGRTEATRRSQRILIGPWTHALGNSRVGQVDFGLHADVDLQAEELRWFDYWLKGMDTGIKGQPPVQVFTTGVNRWTYANEWPLPETRFTPFFLHSGGHANTLIGDCRLSPDEPGSESPDRFDYDPAHPVPTIGGNHSNSPEYLPAGPFDQRAIEMRADMLVYTSAILTSDVQVTGPVQARLYVASSAPDTDFSARLVDVSPTGFAMNLCEGIIRCKYRNSWEQPELMTPNRACEVTVDLGVTSHVFGAGHCIRLDVSSSSFPRFDRNLNTGEPIARATRMQIAYQSVLHSMECPSRVILPVVPQ
jgi:putative CocE/NonD family hydrolase